jgi:ubiquinone/menaquinone biosynthesis C-methylase UbiE
MSPEQWSGERVARWLRQAPAIERQLQPLSDLLFAAARLHTGESVLDVGCGTGPSTRVAAEAVGPTGRVVGLDVSRDMLDAAAASSTMTNIEWVDCDAVTWAWSGPPFDVVISRLGIMFFSDPPAAFANLASVTRKGGRFAAAAWTKRDDSELFEVPLHAAVGVVRDRGITTVSTGVSLDDLVASVDDSAWSLHDAAALVDLLERAGWRHVVVEDHSLAFPLGGGVPPAAAAKVALDVGPTRVLLTGLDDDVRDAAERAMIDALANYVDGDGNVVLSGRIHIVTANRR